MLGRILAIVIKEFRQIRRDTRTLGLLLVLPALLLVLYGYALSFDVRHLAVAVLDHDRTAASRALVDGLVQSEYFDLVGRVTNQNEAADWLDAGRAQVVLAVPPGFAKGLDRGDPLPVQALVDGANAATATAAIGYLEAGAREHTLRLLRDSPAATLPGAGSPLLTLEPRVYYNPTLESSRFLVPGLIGFLLMVIGAISTSLSVVREKEQGTLEQVVVSAVRPAEFILGKTLPYLLLLLVTETLVIGAAMLLFDMPLRGSLGWLALASAVYLAGGLGFGLWVSSVALSNLIFPIASMPPFLQAVTNLVPARHFIAILRGLILKGTGPAAWGRELALLVLFAVVILAVASLRLAREMRTR
ncbi:MAG: ABC transporter permease [Candidatus Latescibacterota bacterium]|jgi:ABC-2 type transport system permease protein